MLAMPCWQRGVGNLANVMLATWPMWCWQLGQCGLGDVYLTIWTEYELNKLLIHFNNKVGLHNLTNWTW
jgi:hypothetical protein